MNSPAKIKTIGLVCKPRNSKTWSEAKKLNAYFLSHGIQTYILGSFKDRDALVSCNEKTMGQHCDLIVSLGGDGTLLFVAREFSEFAVPIVGINYGLIGHLNQIQPKNKITALDKVLAGNFTISEHPLIKHNIKPALGARVGKVAVNDIVIRGARGISMIEVQVSVAEQTFNYRADGLIVSTPIGSTSYSQSAGGPILQTSLNSILITPICAHIKRIPSYVCDDNQKIKIEINSTKSRSSQIYCDGQFSVQMKNPITVEVKKTKKNLKLVRLNPS